MGSAHPHVLLPLLLLSLLWALSLADESTLGSCPASASSSPPSSSGSCAAAPAAGSGSEGSRDSSNSSSSSSSGEVALVEELFKWAADNGMLGLVGPDANVKVTLSSPLIAKWVLNNTAATSDGSGIAAPPRAEIGLVATRRLSRDATLFTVPLALQMRSDVLARDDRARELYTQQQQEQPHSSNDVADLPPLYRPEFHGGARSEWYGISLVAAMILREMAAGEKSFWAPYLRSLPHDVDLSPVFYPPELIDEMKYEPVMTMAREYQATYRYEYERINPAAIANATYDEFAHAMALVLSRSFHVPVLPELASHITQATAMLPIVDLLNHADSYNMGWVAEDGNTKIRCVVYADVEEGGELYNHYGFKNNDHLLVAYGFVTQRNSHDDVIIADNDSDALALFAKFQEIPHPLAGDGSAAAASDGSGSSSSSAGGAVEWEEWMNVMRKAREAVAKAKKKLYGEEVWDAWLVGLKYEVGPESIAMSFYAKDHIDARLFVGFTALWHRLAFKSEPPFDKLAEAILPYAWALTEQRCTEGDVELNVKEELSIRAAASTLEQIAEQRFLAFNVTQVEDEMSLKKLKKECGVGAGGGGGCTEEKRLAVARRRAVLLLRRGKVKILMGVMNRIGDSCRSLMPGKVMKLSMVTDGNEDDANASVDPGQSLDGEFGSTEGVADQGDGDDFMAVETGDEDDDPDLDFDESELDDDDDDDDDNDDNDDNEEMVDEEEDF